MGDDFLEALLGFLVVLKIEEAFSDDIYQAVGIENDAFFQESRRVVDNRKV